MPTGILGQAAPAATTNTTVYTVPAATIVTCNISVCNRGTIPIYVRIALSASGTPSNSEYIEYDAEILANQVLERSGIVLNATKNVVVYTDTATASFSVYGYEA